MIMLSQITIWVTFFIILHYIVIIQAYSKDQHDECSTWAAEGECINNPVYLWHNCQTSCATFSKDSHELCHQWAKEGECTANPKYVAIRCHESCGYALSWSPYLRRKAGLENLQEEKEYDILTICPTTSSVVQAAMIMHERLKVLFNGGFQVPNVGFAATAPSDFLGYLGIAEGILYTFRLYAFIIDSSQDSTLIAAHRERLEKVLAILSKGWDGDFLMRHLMSFMDLLFEAQNTVIDIYKPHTDISSLQVLCDLQDLSPSIPQFIHSGIASLERLGLNQDAVISDMSTYYTLLNGVKMPVIGLGTWQLQGEECMHAVYHAIQLGYRHIDSAEAYQNEVDVGVAISNAIKEGIVKREDLFIATKLSDENNAGYEKAKLKVMQQLHDLQLDYLDLYMLHSPIQDKSLQKETWQALTELYKEGKIKALGVSNFDRNELQNLIQTSEILPMVVQNKFDVYHVGKQLDNRGDNIVKYARENNILMVAYSSFSAYPFSLLPTSDPIVDFVAKRQLVPTTSAQVLLRWTLQLGGTAVIPRSTNIKNLKENLDVLTMQPLSTEDMALLNTLQFLIASPVSLGV